MDPRPLLEDESVRLSADYTVQQKVLTSLLIGMGFSLSSIQLAVQRTVTGDLEEALDFLTKGDDGWTHPFLRSFHSANEDATRPMCVVCGEGVEEHQEHVFHQREHSLRMSRSIARKTSDTSSFYTAHSERLCEICLEEIEQEWTHPNCKLHVFCKPCVRDYAASKLTSGLDIRCPGLRCECVLNTAQLTSLLGAQSTARYVEFRKKAELASNPLLKWCPVIDCPGYIIADRNTQSQSCPVCRTRLCSLCGLKTHEGLACDAALDQRLEQWAQGKPVKRCPSCTRYIEKFDGCDHITCVACRHEWCWMCLGVYTADHFSPESLNFCAVLRRDAVADGRVLWRDRSACSRAQVVSTMVALYPLLVVMYYLLFPVFLFRYLSMSVKWSYWWAIPITLLYPVAPLMWVGLLEWTIFQRIQEGNAVPVRVIWTLGLQS